MIQEMELLIQLLQLRLGLDKCSGGLHPEAVIPLENAIHLIQELDGRYRAGDINQAIAALEQARDAMVGSQ